MWGDAQVLNRIPGWIDAVTSADLQRVARNLSHDAEPRRHRPVPAAMAATKQPAAAAQQE